jgi:hypothetical protein
MNKNNIAMRKNVVVLLLIIVALKTEAQTSVFTVVDSLLLQGDSSKGKW